jgi:hypothetical protein
MPGEFWTWCDRRTVKIIWTNHVRSEEVLQRVNKDRNILHMIKGMKANWISHFLRTNCLLKQITVRKIGGMIEVMRRQERRHKQLMDGCKEKRRYWNLKEKALGHTLWKTHFGRGHGSVVRQITEWMNTDVCNLILEGTDGWTDRQITHATDQQNFKQQLCMRTKFSQHKYTIQNMTHLKNGENCIMNYRIHVLNPVLLKYLIFNLFIPVRCLLINSNIFDCYFIYIWIDKVLKLERIRRSRFIRLMHINVG